MTVIHTDMPLTLTSPAKLNLFLHINGRRPDGYHELQTVFQLLDYGDTLTFRLNHTDKLELLRNLPGVPAAANLILKAANDLKSVATEQGINNLPGIDIDIVKRLPMGGGLGGGSSNAATTLVALNYLWKLHFPIDQLAAIGLRSGADVPVFVRGRTAWGEGVGELLTPLPFSLQDSLTTSPNCFLVVKPDCEVSTAMVFSHKRLTRDTPKRKIAPAVERIDSSFRNDCQAVVSETCDEVRQALEWLNHYGEARLTGTGSCIFAEFGSRAEAEEVLHLIPRQWSGFVAKGVIESPMLQELSRLSQYT